MILLALSGTATAATWSIPKDFSTFADALDAASDGDTIEVEPGDWSDESVEWGEGELTVTGIGGSAVTTSPFWLVGGGSLILSGFTLPCAKDLTTIGVVYGELTLDDITASDCETTHLVALLESSATLSDVSFEDIEGTTSGTGVYIDSASLTVRDSTFSDLDADGYGAAIHMTDYRSLDAELSVYDTTFSGLEASSGGGAVAVEDVAMATFEGVVFERNTADEGGALLAVDTDAVVLDGVVFDANQSADGVVRVRDHDTAASTVSASNLVFTDHPAVVLPPVSLPAELTKGPVVVKAWAPWCGSCRALAPHIDHAASTSGVPVVDVQVDADPDNLVAAFEVRSVPTLIGLRDGTEVARLTGAQPADTVEALFTTTRTGTGSVTNQTPIALAALRGAAGAALAVAGLVFNTVVLVAVGTVLLGWALAGLARRTT